MVKKIQKADAFGYMDNQLLTLLLILSYFMISLAPYIDEWKNWLSMWPKIWIRYFSTFYAKNS